MKLPTYSSLSECYCKPSIAKIKRMALIMEQGRSSTFDVVVCRADHANKFSRPQAFFELWTDKLDHSGHMIVQVPGANLGTKHHSSHSLVFSISPLLGSSVLGMHVKQFERKTDNCRSATANLQLSAVAIGTTIGRGARDLSRKRSLDSFLCHSDSVGFLLRDMYFGFWLL
jgi:hypothetical protein